MRAAADEMAAILLPGDVNVAAAVRVSPSEFAPCGLMSLPPVVLFGMRRCSRVFGGTHRIERRGAGFWHSYASQESSDFSTEGPDLDGNSSIVQTLLSLCLSGFLP